MALISCPECGREISDKVKACPHCGFPFQSDEETDVASLPPQQVELTGVNLKKKVNWKPVVIGLAILVVGLIVLFSIQRLNKVKAQRDYELAFNAYIDDLDLLRLSTISGGAKAETLTNLTAKVWANSIYEDADSETDKYTRINGNGSFYDDFNTALSKLFSDSSTVSQISNIEGYQDSAKSLMEKIQNPPAGLENCYETATDMYTAFMSLTNLAINPSGSLQTFNQDRNSKINTFLDLYNKLDTQIPEQYMVD